jgi:hypothetical protein
LIPPRTPRVAENTIKKNNIFIETKEIRTKGAIFCQVRITNDCSQSEHIITCGNQKWRGATPALVRSDTRIKVLNVKTFILNKLRYEEIKYA